MRAFGEGLRLDRIEIKKNTQLHPSIFWILVGRPGGFFLARFHSYRFFCGVLGVICLDFGSFSPAQKRCQCHPPPIERIGIMPPTNILVVGFLRNFRSSKWGTTFASPTRCGERPTEFLSNDRARYIQRTDYLSIPCRVASLGWLRKLNSGHTPHRLPTTLNYTVGGECWLVGRLLGPRHYFIRRAKWLCISATHVSRPEVDSRGMNEWAL